MLQPREGSAEGDTSISSVPGIHTSSAPLRRRVHAGEAVSRAQNPLSHGLSSTADADIDALLAFIEGTNTSSLRAGGSNGSVAPAGQAAVVPAPAALQLAAQPAAGKDACPTATPERAVPPHGLAPLQLRRERSDTMQSMQSNGSAESDGYDEDTGTPTSMAEGSAAHRAARALNSGDASGSDAAAMLAASKSKSQKRRERAKARKARIASQLGASPAAVAARLPAVSGGSASVSSTAALNCASLVTGTTSAAGGGGVSTSRARTSQTRAADDPGTVSSSSVALPSDRAQVGRPAAHGRVGQHAAGATVGVAARAAQRWAGADDPMHADAATTSSSSPPLRSTPHGKGALRWPARAAVALHSAAEASSTSADVSPRLDTAPYTAFALADAELRPSGILHPKLPPSLVLPPTLAASGDTGGKCTPVTGCTPPSAAAAVYTSAAGSGYASTSGSSLNGTRGVQRIKEQLLSGTLSVRDAAVDELFSEDAFDDDDGDSAVEAEVEQFKRRLGLVPSIMVENEPAGEEAVAALN